VKERTVEWEEMKKKIEENFCEKFKNDISIKVDIH
jgi:hypothetical protein